MLPNEYYNKSLNTAMKLCLKQKSSMLFESVLPVVFFFCQQLANWTISSSEILELIYLKWIHVKQVLLLNCISVLNCRLYWLWQRWKLRRWLIIAKKNSIEESSLWVHFMVTSWGVRVAQRNLNHA